MSRLLQSLRRPSLAFAISLVVVLASCGLDHELPIDPSTLTAPSGVGHPDIALVTDEAITPPYVDNAATNQRGDARYATMQTNAGVRVVAGFLDLWTPSTLLVDASVTAPGTGAFPAVVASSWTGIPGDATDGTVKNAAVLNASLQYVIDATSHRTAEQAKAAYVDDRRGKGYSVTDGLGPLTGAWRTAAQQTTTIIEVPADANVVKYDDKGNNTGVGGTSNAAFGAVVDFVNSLSNNGSTEPAKRFFKYARPWRWSSSVMVPPTLEPAKSSTPATDGSFISGHAAEATRDALAMAYLVPERFQELIARGLELGENRILAGMHTPLDVIAGRIQAQAVVTANLMASTAQTRKVAFDQAHAALMAAAGTADLLAFNDAAHSGPPATDRFADHLITKANALRRMTYGLGQIADGSKSAVVPKGAEVLLETRFPYLDSAQRRVVLKTTELSSGYPVMDDAEGWGRLDLFAAGDGFGNFNGDVSVTMDASLGGFNAVDTWRNDISGEGLLTKSGTGTLRLSGANTYTGGTVIEGGTLEADSSTALGAGAVFVKAGVVVSNAPGELKIGSSYTQLSDGTLELRLGPGGQGHLTVTGKVTLAGGKLTVKLLQGNALAVGDVVDVIRSDSRQGKFTTIEVDGHAVTPVYSSTGVRLHIDS